jgi:hypothetical protein
MTYPDPELGLVTMGGIPLVVDDELEHDDLEVDRGPAGQVVELRARQHVVDRILDALRQPSTLNPQPDIETPAPSTLNPDSRVSVHDFGRAGSVLARDVRGRPEGRPSPRQEPGPR